MTEPATTISGVTKALAAIKDFPLWLLTGIALSLIAFLSMPQFSGAVPQETRTWITVAAITAAILAACRFGSVVTANVKARRKRIRKSEATRFFNVYVPLFAHLFRIHITTTVSSRAPKFRDRLENAWDILSGRRYRVAAIKAAWKALFERQLSTTGEVDYGGEFPFTMLKFVVEHNLSVSDERLLNLISASEQSHLESQIGRDLLTQEDIELFDHIVTEHARLKKVLSQ